MKRWKTARPSPDDIGPTLGAEEEFFLVDERGELVDGAPILLPDGDRPHLKHELFECIVEVTTPVARSIDEIESALTAGRALLASMGAEHGLRPFASGTHPAALDTPPRVTNTPRYRNVAIRLGSRLSDQLLCGLHVHVGLGSPAATTNALEGVVDWLPSVLALAVNSPFESGRESGVRSTRALRLGQLEDSPLPAVAETRGDPKSSDWWDVRVNRRYSTLEVRVADQPTDVERSVALVALVQALAITAAARRNAPADRLTYGAARDRALRTGEVANGLVEHIEPVAAALGTLGLISALVSSEREADRQIRIAWASGIDALVEDITAGTVSTESPHAR
jgi:carboxylate-amine ligase